MPPLRLQDAAHPPSRAAPVKAPGFVAEQLALDERLGDRRAVDRDEGLVGAVAGVMDGARAVALAGAGLPEQQHRDIPIDHAPQRLDVLCHDCIGRVQAVERTARARRAGHAQLGVDRHLGAWRGFQRRLHGREPAPCRGPGVERLGAEAALRGELHERGEAGIEDTVGALAAHRIMAALPEELERRAVDAAHHARVVERQQAFAGRADELRAAVKTRQVQVLAATEQRAVLDVLRRHVDQRQRVALRIRGGPGDIERREQLAAHVEMGAAEQVSAVFCARKWSVRWITTGRRAVRQVPMPLVPISRSLHITPSRKPERLAVAEKPVSPR